MTPTDQLALVDRFRRLPAPARQALYDHLKRTAGKLADLRYDWKFWARPDQVVTDAELRGQKLVVFTGIRGTGKTRAAVQLWVRRILEGKSRRPRIIAATEADVDKTVVHGESGIMSILPPHQRPTWVKSDGCAGVLRFPNGVEALCYSAAKADQITGSQGDCDLYDDFAKWGSTGELAWRNARASCRIGDGLGILATTRRGIDTLRKYLKGDVAGVLVRRPPNLSINRFNLTANHAQQMQAEMGDTDFHRQEMEDEDISSESPFHGLEFDKPPIRILQALRSEFSQIVVIVDPADGKGGDHDEWGIGAAGRRHDRHVVALEDASGQFDDNEAADKVLELVERWGARTIVFEKNRGEKHVTRVLQAAHWRRQLEQGAEKVRPLPDFVGVTAREGKKLRAGPLKALYVQGLLHHVAGLGALERQQREWDPDGPKRPRQDDRIDWLVQACHHLADLGGDGGPTLDQVAGIAERVARMQAGASAAGAAAGARESLIKSDTVPPGDPRAPASPRRARPPLAKRNIM